MRPTNGQIHTVEVMGEDSSHGKVLGVLADVVLEPSTSPTESIARIRGVLRRERKCELEAGEHRAEIDELRAITVDAVAGAVGRAITGDARVREVEAVDGRAVRAEDLGGARHCVAHRRQRAILVAELNFAEPSAEIGVDLPDLVLLRLSTQLHIRAYRESVVENGLAAEGAADVLLEGIVAHSILTAPGGRAEVLAGHAAGGGVVPAADAEFDAVGCHRVGSYK